MSVSDPVADMLSKIRNASMARHESVDVSSSKGKLDGIKGKVDLDKCFVESFGQPVDNVVNNLPKYEVNKNYTIKVDLNVREGDGTNYKIKNYNELTVDGKNHAYNQQNAVLKPNTRVTCLGIYINNDEVWLKIPSGFVCAYYHGEIYIK